MLTVAAVCTGTKYGPEYVDRLFAGVMSHLRPDRLLFLYDSPRPALLWHGTWVAPDGSAKIETRDITHLKLPGYWAKMALFDPMIRGPGRCLFLDLDSVIVGELAPLVRHETDFAICGSFTRAAGNDKWPCRYGSCAMVFGEGWGEGVWRRFNQRRDELMALPHGDQQAIETLLQHVKQPMILQDVVPPGFFLNYRQLEHYPKAPPARASIVVFGGSHKPHNCAIPWVREAWHGNLGLA